MKIFFFALLTLLFAFLGFVLSQMVQALPPRTLLSTCAGSAGGFGIGCAINFVIDEWRRKYSRV